MPAVVTGLALIVGVLAFFVQTRWAPDSEAVLTAVIAAATVAYAGYTWLPVRSMETAREDRQRADEAAMCNLWRAILVELEQNEQRRGQTYAYRTYIPFERSALDAARHVRAELPAELAVLLQEVETRIARFNALARYDRERLGQNRPANKQLNELADEVHHSVAGAVEKFRPWVDSQCS